MSMGFRSGYPDLFSADALPVLEEVFMSELEMHPDLRPKLFKMVSTDRDIYQASELHDVQMFNQMSEGETYSYVAQKAGANKTFTMVKWGLGLKFTEELIDDGKIGFVPDGLKKLAKSGRESQQVEAMSIFNNGFSAETAADGQPVFDQAHTLPSGGTFRNELETAADLDPESLRQAVTDFSTQFVGDSGIIYRPRPKTLLVPTALEAYARELVGSQLKPDSSDNNLNSLKGEGLVVVSSPHLTDDDAWFLLADPSETGLRVVVRKAMETKAAGPDAGFDDDSIKYKSRYREDIGVIGAQGIFGSPGAA